MPLKFLFIFSKLTYKKYISNNENSSTLEIALGLLVYLIFVIYITYSLLYIINSTLEFYILLHCFLIYIVLFFINFHVSKNEKFFWQVYAFGLSFIMFLISNNFLCFSIVNFAFLYDKSFFFKLYNRLFVDEIEIVKKLSSSFKRNFSYNQPPLPNGSFMVKGLAFLGVGTLVAYTYVSSSEAYELFQPLLTNLQYRSDLAFISELDFNNTQASLISEKKQLKEFICNSDEPYWLKKSWISKVDEVPVIKPKRFSIPSDVKINHTFFK